MNSKDFTLVEENSHPRYEHSFLTLGVRHGGAYLRVGETAKTGFRKSPPESIVLTLPQIDLLIEALQQTKADLMGGSVTANGKPAAYLDDVVLSAAAKDAYLFLDAAAKGW